MNIIDRFPDLQRVDDIERAFYIALRPPEILTVSEWADQNRVLDSRSPEPGAWQTARVPYMREPMDRLSVMDPCWRVVIQGGAQVSKTECIHNALGYFIAVAPGPALVVQATVEMGRDWSKDRFQSVIDTTPVLQKLFGQHASGEAKDKDSDNTIRYKRFPGGSLFVAGANSPSGLRSKPIQYLLLDEVDSYPDTAGKEGDPVALAEKRTSNFTRKKIIMVSTPTIKDESRIEKAYKDSDQRKYFVPCPHCAHMQVLQWKQVTWEHTGNPNDAYYECESDKGCVIEESSKPFMLEKGEWRAMSPGGGDGRTHGYHISALYSPWKTWAVCAQEFVQAKPPGSYADQELLKTFVNTVLGETWDDQGARQVDYKGIMARREIWWDVEASPSSPILPRRAAVVTLGVDVQEDRIEGFVWGWGPGKEGWLIDRWVIPGVFSEQNLQDDLDAKIDTTYPHELDIELAIDVTCIDSGYATDDVYDFCAKRKKKRVWAIKGEHESRGKPIWTNEALKGPKVHKRRAVYPVGTYGAKSWVYTALALDKAQIHFPELSWCNEEFFKQLCSNKKKPKSVHGRIVYYWWKPDHAADEALDGLVYALGGLEGLLMNQPNRLERMPNGVEAARRRRELRAVAPPRGPSSGPSSGPTQGPVQGQGTGAASGSRPAAPARQGFLGANRNWLRGG